MGGKKNFWKGVLVGALAMFSVSLLVGGALTATFMYLGGRDMFSYNSAGDENSIVDADTLKKLEEIQKLIDENYLYSDKIDSKLVQEAILRGYVNGLNEPYSVYYNAKETEELFEMTSGTFGGIGVGIQQDKTSGLVTFTTIYKNAPGEKAGFRSGDIVYKVDGEDVSGQDLDTIVSKIRGEIGTEVEITVVRDGEEYTAKATRALIENDTVHYEMKEDGIGYIQVTAFEEVTYKQFGEAMNDLNKQGMKGLTIDLRNNGGGNLSTVCQMCDLILPKGNIVSIKDKNGNGQSYQSDDKTILNVPTVVLINGFSASASEIFAGAIQDYGVGTVVGTTSYGKGLVQGVFTLSDGTCVKLTTAEYFTANGRNIHGLGIKPDVEIEYKYDASNPLADNQMDKALEILKKGM